MRYKNEGTGPSTSATDVDHDKAALQLCIMALRQQTAHERRFHITDPVPHEARLYLRSS
jgi:hypothetical protein